MGISLELNKANRLLLARHFRTHPRVDLGIDSALEGQMGAAFVDSLYEPTAFMIQQGPFCYFAGDPLSPGGRRLLQDFPQYMLFMPSPPEWIAALRDLRGKQVVDFPRYSFSTAHLSLDHLDRLLENQTWMPEIKALDADILNTSLLEPEGPVDISSFDSVEDFLERGLGYGIVRNGKLIGAAYSSLVCSWGIEVSLYVEPDWRRKGVATALAGRLVRESLARGLKANWDAANMESCRLAEKLGYTPAGTYQAFYWDNDL